MHCCFQSLATVSAGTSDPFEIQRKISCRPADIESAVDHAVQGRNHAPQIDFEDEVKPRKTSVYSANKQGKLTTLSSR